MEGTNVQSVCISNAKSKNSAPFPCICFFPVTFFLHSSLQAVSITGSSLLSDVKFIPVVSLPSVVDKLWSSGSKAVWRCCCYGWAPVLISQLPVARSIWSVSCTVGTVAVFNITCMFHAWNLSFSFWNSCSAEAGWPVWLCSNRVQGLTAPHPMQRCESPQLLDLLTHFVLEKVLVFSKSFSFRPGGCIPKCQSILLFEKFQGEVWFQCDTEFPLKVHEV